MFDQRDPRVKDMADQPQRALRSAAWFGTADKNGFMYRSWMKNQGIPDHEFQGKPVIGICNTWSELTPCNAHFRKLAEHVKRGISEAGGFPVEFPVFSNGESNLRPTAMLTKVDPAVLCDVIASGGANSTAFQRLRPCVLEGDDQGFRFSLDNALKDMHYYARMSAQARAVSFIAGAVHNTYTVAKHFGAGAQFVPHLVQRVGLLNGLTLPATGKDGAGD